MRAILVFRFDPTTLLREIPTRHAANTEGKSVFPRQGMPVCASYNSLLLLLLLLLFSLFMYFSSKSHVIALCDKFQEWCTASTTGAYCTAARRSSWYPVQSRCSNAATLAGMNCILSVACSRFSSEYRTKITKRRVQ